ncbi:MAG: NAD-dependent epimerase/dehydratase family protein [Bacteroidales bacterium]|nr:NAD-dependent epimerase/dehydratase family protein [Bacteroidales bacterium]
MTTILVLGGFGFIATNILRYIDRNAFHEYEAVIFDKFPHHIKGVACQCVKRVYSGDFADELIIEKIFRENKIDIVLHCLSNTVPATSQNARFDVESNLIPTLNLLAIMERHDVKDIVYLSSGGAIYGDALQKIHNEEEAVYPKSSYGIVKLAIEKYLLSFSELYGFRTLILRLSNPFGPYHYNDRQGFINIAIRRALKGLPIEIWGSGEGKKDYIYIDDVSRIIHGFLDSGIETGVYNVASGIVLSVNQIANHVAAEFQTTEIKHIDASKIDVQSFQLDITKLQNRFKDLVFTDFQTAFIKTVEWQKNNID